MRVVCASTVLFGLVACGESSAPVSDEAPAAAQAEAPPPPADVDVDLPTLPEGDSLSVDSASSKINFKGAKVTGSHDGGFSVFTGTVVLSDDSVVATQFEIDMASTESDHPKVTKHLLSKDFFHVEKYPKATFVSSKMVAAEEPGAVTHNVQGVLQFHGKTRPLSFPATVTVGEAATTVEATFDINRQNWGVAYPGKPDDLIKDDVQIHLNLRFPSGGEDVGEGSGDNAEAGNEPATEPAKN